MFSLSPSLYSLCPVSLSISSFTWPTLSRKVPPCEPGPAQGFFLLKGSFPCHCASLGVQVLGFEICKAPRDNFIVKRRFTKKLNWIEWHVWRAPPRERLWTAHNSTGLDDMVPWLKGYLRPPIVSWNVQLEFRGKCKRLLQIHIVWCFFMSMKAGTVGAHTVPHQEHSDGGTAPAGSAGTPAAATRRHKSTRTRFVALIIILLLLFVFLLLLLVVEVRHAWNLDYLMRMLTFYLSLRIGKRSIWSIYY